MAPPDFCTFLAAFPMACWPVAALLYFASYPSWAIGAAVGPLIEVALVTGLTVALLLTGVCAGTSSILLFIAVVILVTSRKRNGG